MILQMVKSCGEKNESGEGNAKKEHDCRDERGGMAAPMAR